MPSYKLVTYQSAKGPRAGVVVDDKLFDAAALTRKAAYVSMMDILNDWSSAKGTLKKAAAAAEAIMSPAADARGPVEYRKHVGGIMVTRALQRAAGRAR